MIRDVRASTAILLIVAALTLPPTAQAFLLASAWMLPHLFPSMFMPATPQRRIAWCRFQPFALMFVVLSVLIQGIFGPDPRFDLVMVRFSAEGMETGLEISLRAILILTGILAALMPMRPLEMSHWLTKLGLPAGIPVAILLSLQMVEDLPETVRRIRRAQRSRGLRLEGSLPARLRAFRFLITPVVMRSLEGSIERATALQLRGLLDPLPRESAAPRSGAIGIVLLLLAIGLIIIRILEWLRPLPSIV
jgi:energy-coupling factor transporter transmembrane protein EcfT